MTMIGEQTINSTHISHYVDNILTQAEARMGLRNTRLLVTWYTNIQNEQSVVHSHPYYELVLPIGGSTVRYSVDGSVYMVHPGELIYFPAQVYHSGNFNIDADHSDRLVIQIDDALWQASRRDAADHGAGSGSLSQMGFRRSLPPHGTEPGAIFSLS